MNAHRLLAIPLLAAVPAWLSAAPPAVAAPKDRFETVPRTEAAADSFGVPHAVEEPDVLPMIEGAGGPHRGKHEAPHGGALVPIGVDTAHLEFLLDPDTGMMTMYVLDGEAKELMYLPQEIVFFKLAADGDEFAMALFQMDDTGTVRAEGGRAARYMASHRRLQGVERFEALLEGITFGRQSYHRVPFTYPEGTE